MSGPLRRRPYHIRVINIYTFMYLYSPVSGTADDGAAQRVGAGPDDEHDRDDALHRAEQRHCTQQGGRCLPKNPPRPNMHARHEGCSARNAGVVVLVVVGGGHGEGKRRLEMCRP